MFFRLIECGLVQTNEKPYLDLSYATKVAMVLTLSSNMMI